MEDSEMPVKVGLRYIDIWTTNLEKEVVRYEEQNDEKGQIVFYGPSYYARWDGRDGGLPMADMIKGASGKKCVVNRGFGSSCSEHQLYYYPRMVRAIEPKVLVYESFANHGAFDYSAEECWELAQRVIMYTLIDFPDIQIYLCGTYPCPKESSPEAEKERETYNGFIKEFIKDKPNCHYIDVLNYPEIKNHENIESLFLDDKVHPNEKGYEVLARMYNEALKDELAKF